MAPWETELIVALQSGGEAITDLFAALTFLGNQEFYLLLLPLLFWCIDRALGARLAVLYLVSGILNTDIKDVIRAPRPFAIDAGLLAVDDPEAIYATGYGMPSGHAQITLTVWGALAVWLKKGWFWTIALVVVFLVGLSRVGLGAHTPSQVGVGWLIGLVALLVYLALYAPLELWLGDLSFGAQMLVAVAVPAALLVVHPVPDVIAATAVLLGLGVGLVVAERYVSMETGGPIWQRAARYLLGVVVLLALYLGLSAILPGEGEALYVPLRFGRYALLGLWITLGAPWVFQLLHLQSVSGAPLVQAD